MRSLLPTQLINCNSCWITRMQSSDWPHVMWCVYWQMCYNDTLQRRHNGRDGVSNHQPHDCLLSRLFRCRSKKISKLRVTGLCEGNSLVTGEFPAQRASNAEYVPIWWRHHDLIKTGCGALIENVLCKERVSIWSFGVPLGFEDFSNAGSVSIVGRCGLLIQMCCGTAIPELLESDIYQTESSIQPTSTGCLELILVQQEGVERTPWSQNIAEWP